MVSVPKHYFKIIMAILCTAVVVLAFLLKDTAAYIPYDSKDEILEVLKNYFDLRCSALLTGDIEAIQNQFDLSSRYGKWSYEREVNRVKFVEDWSYTRDTRFTDCRTNLRLLSSKGDNNNLKIYLNDMTWMTYVYKSQKESQTNEFCFSAYHYMSMVKKDGIWYVNTDWYSDPLDESMPVSGETVSYDNSLIDSFSGGWFKYDRAKAVEYADKYCGANMNLEDGYKYNRKYRNFAGLGGDCANFVSQALSDKDAGGMRTDGGWQYIKGEASASWVNASKFTTNLLYSGRARLIAKGKYLKVADAAKNLSPGDVIAYARNGRIAHVTIVAKMDSMGVPMVDAHTVDIYHVPWEMGWTSDDVTFWLLKING